MDIIETHPGEKIVVPLVAYINGDRYVVGKASIEDGQIRGELHGIYDKPVRELFRIHGGEFSITPHITPAEPYIKE